MVKRAIEMAIRVHEGQFRKYHEPPVPYVRHPLRVASFVAVETRGDEEMIAAACMHDTIEDHSDRISIEEIGNFFGERVAALVNGMTNASKKVESAALMPRADRKKLDRTYLQAQSPDVATLKLIDRIDNITDLRLTADNEKSRKFSPLYAQESRLLVQALTDESVHSRWRMTEGDRRCRAVVLLAAELCREIDKLEKTVEVWSRVGPLNPSKV